MLLALVLLDADSSRTTNAQKLVDSQLTLPAQDQTQEINENETKNRNILEAEVREVRESKKVF